MYTKIYMKYCPRCGDIDYRPHSSLNINKEEHMICYVCGYELRTIDPQYDLYDEFEYNGTYNHFQEMKERIKNFTEEVIKPNPEFDPELYARKDEIIEQKQNQQMEEFNRQTHGASWLDDQRGNKPKCPTCNSNNIRKISATSKMTNTILFGILGTKRNKTFHCNSCGYEW